MNNGEEFSQWSETSPEAKTFNLFSTLSQNLRRYQFLQRGCQPKLSTYRIKNVKSRNIIREEAPIVVNQCFTEPTSNQENQPRFLNVGLKLPETSREVGQPVRRYPKTSNGSRQKQEEMRSLKSLVPREVKFERRDRKKGKDRWVDIFLAKKGNSDKVSLRKLDSINKQQKEEKIDLFMKLIKK